MKKRKTQKIGIGGFEPTNDGVKVHCLTTWLYPKKSLMINKVNYIEE